MLYFFKICMQCQKKKKKKKKKKKSAMRPDLNISAALHYNGLIFMPQKTLFRFSQNFPIVLSQAIFCLKLWNLDVINILTQRHNFLYLYFFVFQKFIAKST